MCKYAKWIPYVSIPICIYDCIVGVFIEEDYVKGVSSFIQIFVGPVAAFITACAEIAIGVAKEWYFRVKEKEKLKSDPSYCPKCLEKMEDGFDRDCS